jgi:hypothetical protein
VFWTAVLLSLILLYQSIDNRALANVITLNLLNNTGLVADDLHLTLQGDRGAFLVTASQASPLQTPAISPEPAKTVTLDWSAPPFSIPINALATVYLTLNVCNGSVISACPLGISITSAYFTQGGTFIGNIGILSPLIYATGPAPRRRVTRVVDQLAVGPPMVAVHEFYEDFVSTTETPAFINTSAVPVFASTSTAFFDQEVLPEALNDNLTGFGPASPFELYLPSTVPEPSSLFILLTSLLALGGIAKMRQKFVC